MNWRLMALLEALKNLAGIVMAIWGQIKLAIVDIKTNPFNSILDIVGIVQASWDQIALAISALLSIFNKAEATSKLKG